MTAVNGPRFDLDRLTRIRARLVGAPLAVLAALPFIRMIRSIAAAQRDRVPGVASVFA